MVGIRMMVASSTVESERMVMIFRIVPEEMFQGTLKTRAMEDQGLL